MHLSICPFNLKRYVFFLLAWGWQVVVVYGGKAKGAEPLPLTGNTALIRLFDLLSRWDYLWQENGPSLVLSVHSINPQNLQLRFCAIFFFFFPFVLFF